MEKENIINLDEVLKKASELKNIIDNAFIEKELEITEDEILEKPKTL